MGVYECHYSMSVGSSRGNWPVRRDHWAVLASLRSIGAFSNPLLLWGIGFELVLAALLIYAPPFQALLATAALTPDMLLFVTPFPFIVWGADELRRWLLRSRATRRSSGPAAAIS